MATTSYGSPYVSGSDLVAAWPAASLTVANSIDAAGYFVGRGINAQTASYTTVLTDAGKTVSMTNAGATTLTIPANSSVAYVVGSRINILNLGAGACTPTAGAGVTISGTISALATNQGAAVVKTATNTWSYLPFTSGTPTLTSADVSSTTGSPTITTSGANTIYSFTGSGTIVLGKAGLVEAILCIAGGGGGGNQGAGGGGGGHLDSTSVFLAVGTQTITIGAGGSGGPASAPNSADGQTGNASRLGLYVSPGGGGGGGASRRGHNGGSGGGGGMFSGAVGLGLVSQGNDGGLGSASSTAFGGGGGGGAAAVGGAGSSTAGGAGGAGSANSITGSSVTRAGGGGGGARSGAGGVGGTGGGGAGTANNTTATAGGANTGGGGGAGGYGSDPGGVGGAGGSGVVIIKVVT